MARAAGRHSCARHPPVHARRPFFAAAGDLPSDIATRDRVLLAAMARRPAPDRRPGRRAPADEQGRHRRARQQTRRRPRLPVRPAAARQDTVDTTPSFLRQHARRRRAVRARDRYSRAPRATTTLRVLTLNTDMQCDITVDARQARSPTRATRASTVCRARRRRSRSSSSTPRARSPRACPTGHVRDTIDGLEVTCIDGMPS